MAFPVGVPARVIKQVTDRMVRISQPGVGAEVAFALGAGATGTIGLHKKLVAADITLPEGFMPGDYKRAGADVSLQDSIDVKVRRVGSGAVPMPLTIVKTGTTPEDFEISITNGGGNTTGQLEIYVEFH